jgi:hypothetical protein
MNRPHLIQRSATPCPPPRHDVVAREGPAPPTLTFSPYAWAKLLFLRDCGGTEIGAFGIASPRKLLHVEDLVPVRQQTTAVTVVFDDDAVAQYFEEQTSGGRHPREFARIWVHTHPGSSASPSSTDEETFERVFRGCDWAVMFILARCGGDTSGGETYARLRIGQGLNVQLPLAVEVDFTRDFPQANFRGWQEEYEANVHAEPLWPVESKGHADRHPHAGDFLDDPDWDPFGEMDPHVLAAYDQWHLMHEAGPVA